MNTKHTPAPWQAAQRYRSPHWLVSSEKKEEGHLIAEVGNHCPDDVGNPNSENGDSAEEIEANAKLIAAAPEMYFALKFIFQNEWCRRTSGSKSRRAILAVTEWKMLEAALEKAEGRKAPKGAKK